MVVQVGGCGLAIDRIGCKCVRRRIGAVGPGVGGARDLDTHRRHADGGGEHIGQTRRNHPVRGQGLDQRVFTKEVTQPGITGRVEFGAHSQEAFLGDVALLGMAQFEVVALACQERKLLRARRTACLGIEHKLLEGAAAGHAAARGFEPEARSVVRIEIELIGAASLGHEEAREHLPRRAVVVDRRITERELAAPKREPARGPAFGAGDKAAAATIGGVGHTGHQQVVHHHIAVEARVEIAALGREEGDRHQA